MYGHNGAWSELKSLTPLSRFCDALLNQEYEKALEVGPAVLWVDTTLFS